MSRRAQDGVETGSMPGYSHGFASASWQIASMDLDVHNRALSVNLDGAMVQGQCHVIKSTFSAASPGSNMRSGTGRTGCTLDATGCALAHWMPLESRSTRTGSAVDTGRTLDATG